MSTEAHQEMYITGEKIQALADIGFAAASNPIIDAQLKNMKQNICFANKMPIETIIENITNKKIIFVYTHFLDLFFEEVFPFIKNNFVLITHNSDNSVSRKYYRYLVSDKIIKWYGQNVEFEHEKLFSLPIGIANSQWSHGSTELLQKVRTEHNRKSILVYKNYNLTHYGNRKEIDLITNNNGMYMMPRKSQEDYLRDISQSDFCICPPGNGIDCHRIWECLYLNCIPIVHNHINFKQFRDLPILLIEDWKIVDKEFLLKQKKAMVEKKYNLEKLEFSYWKNNILKDDLFHLTPSYQEESNTYHFILIHIGDDLPSHLNSCIKQIRLFNSPDTSTIWVLAYEKELEKVENCLNLKKIPLEGIPLSSEHILFAKSYSNDSLNNFWKYAIERFFYIEEIMRIHDIQRVFHLEYDNMLYVNLKNYLHIFLEKYKGLGITLDCDHRVIPGFVFIRDFKSLELFTQYVVDMIKQNKNDMQLLADFRSFIKNDEVIKTLPVLMPEYDKLMKNSDGYTSFQPQLYINQFEDFQGIYDAAAIGQYLGGISPRNNPQGVNTVGFINETCIFQCSYLTFKWELNENGLKIPFVRYSGANNWHPIFTIHVHSKDLTQFLSDQTVHEDYKNGLTKMPKLISKIGTMDYFKSVSQNESIKPGVQSNLKLDILIPAVEKDLETLPLTIDSVRNNLKHPIGKIIVIAPDSQKLKAVCESKDCEFLLEDSVLSISKKDIHYTVKDLDRSGWLFQQLIKLSGDSISSEEYYLAIDADTVLIRPQVVEVNGKIVLLYSDEHHQPYFDLYKRIFGVRTKTDLSFVGHHMVFKKSFIKEFREHIQKNAENWVSALFRHIDFSQMSGMSEYELYGQWLLQNKGEEIVQEYFFNSSLGRPIYYSLEELQSKLSKFYRSVSFHHHNMDIPSEISFKGFMKETVETSRITMSTLGKNGRFGNQIFQYAFLKIYSKEHNLMVETSEWIGQYLFGHNDPPISQFLPVVREYSYPFHNAILPGASMPLKNVDFFGYFQYHTEYYAAQREYFCSLFKPVNEIEDRLTQGFNMLSSRGNTIIGLHLRYGDYEHRGQGPFFIRPTEWYKKWLADLWDDLKEPVLFIASDEPEKVISEFADYRPVTVEDLQIELPKASFYADFYLLSKCDIVAISNSSFSFAACMLNEKCKLFFRPDILKGKLVPFNPWNSEVLVYDEEIVQPSGNNRDEINNIKMLIENEKIEEAREVTEKAIEKYPDSPDLLNVRGELMMQSGNIEEATKIFLDIKERWPYYVETLNNIATILCYNNNWGDAKKLLQEAIKLSPSNKNIIENLKFVQNEILLSEAERFAQKEKYFEAMTFIKRILNADEQHIGALNLLAFIHIKKGDLEEAMKSLYLVLQVDPSNEEAKESLRYINQQNS
jgi:tetratricopeptide (TPR) repeat protein